MSQFPKGDEQWPRPYPASHALNHGIGGADSLENYFNLFVWKDTAELAMSDLNRVASLGFTDLDLTAYTSSRAKLAIVMLHINVDVIGTGAVCVLKVRKNGSVQDAPLIPHFVIDVGAVTAGEAYNYQCICGLDSGQVLEYGIVVTAGWQIDSRIYVLGYIE